MFPRVSVGWFGCFVIFVISCGWLIVAVWVNSVDYVDSLLLMVGLLACFGFDLLSSCCWFDCVALLVIALAVFCW